MWYQSFNVSGVSEQAAALVINSLAWAPDDSQVTACCIHPNWTDCLYSAFLLWCYSKRHQSISVIVFWEQAAALVVNSLAWAPDDSQVTALCMHPT
jgi:hypothetical protein